MTLKDNFHYIASSNIKETKFNQDGLRLREKYENERCLNLLLHHFSFPSEFLKDVILHEKKKLLKNI